MDRVDWYLIGLPLVLAVQTQRELTYLKELRGGKKGRGREQGKIRERGEMRMIGRIDQTD